MGVRDFDMKPTWVEPEEPVYNVLVTDSDGMKREHILVSTTAVKRYKVTYSGVSDGGYTQFLNHFNSCYGGAYYFDWNSIPSYIESGATQRGYWVSGTWKPKVEARSWDWTITFEVKN